MLAQRAALRARVSVPLRGTDPLAEREDYIASLTAAESTTASKFVAEVCDLGRTQADRPLKGRLQN